MNLFHRKKGLGTRCVPADLIRISCFCAAAFPHTASEPSYSISSGRTSQSSVCKSRGGSTENLLIRLCELLRGVSVHLLVSASVCHTIVHCIVFMWKGLWSFTFITLHRVESRVGVEAQMLLPFRVLSSLDFLFFFLHIRRSLSHTQHFSLIKQWEAEQSIR